MSVHQLKDGRWLVKHYVGKTAEDKPIAKREYFGRGKEAEQLARNRNAELGLGKGANNVSQRELLLESAKYQMLLKNVSAAACGIEVEIQAELLYLLKLAARDEEQIREQVYTPCGFIDMLTPEELIEIKVIYEWKAGVGQLLSYLTSYPDRKLRLHLFERKFSSYSTKSSIATISKICEALKFHKINVSFQDRKTYYEMATLHDNVVPIFRCCPFE